MMTGMINDSREAVLSVEVQGPDGQAITVETIIDTGYNGTLSLPPDLIAALELPSRGARYVTLGDGNTVLLNVYRATIIWDDLSRSVQVMETEDVSLVGMSLLYGYRVILDVVDGGTVTIEPKTL
jgi:clan AA aspartic protease